jgi:protein O-mannosyl-transferase
MKKVTSSSNRESISVNNQGSALKLNQSLADVLKLNYALALIPAMLAVLLYANTFQHDYALDDYPSIVNNEFVKQGFAGIPSILKVDFWYFSNLALGYWRPFSIITFAIEHQFFGANPHISHVINVLLYALTAFMLGLLLQELFKKYKAIVWLLVCLLFVCHPIHTEVVANLKSRDELFSFLGIVSALFFVVRAQTTGKKWQIVLACIIYYLAFMSKESAITLIALLPICLYFLRNKGIVQSMVKTIPFIFVMVLFYFQKNQVIPPVDPDMFLEINNYPYQDAKFPNAMMVFLYLIKMLVLPYPLRYDYSFNQLPVVDFSSPLAIIGILFFMAMVVFVLLKFVKRSIWAFVTAIFLVSILPALGFVMVRGGIFAERFLYASVLSFSILLVFGFAFLFKKSLLLNGDENDSMIDSLKQFPIIGIALSLICVVYSLQTFARNPVWKNNDILTSHDLPYLSESAQANKHFGTTLLMKCYAEKDSIKRLKYADESLPYLKKAIVINSMFGEAWEQIGRYYTDIRYNPDSAIYYYKNCLMSTPKSESAACNMGIVYYRLQKLKLASYYWNRAIMANPNFQNARKYSEALKQATGLDVRTFPTDEDPSGFDPPGPKVIEY